MSCNTARQLRANMPKCDETQYRLGLGVEGQVNGYYLHVGSERFLRQSGIRLDRCAADRERFAERGWSCLHVAIDGAAAGLVAYADRIREESRSVIARLAELGMKESIMLTGDNETVARAVRRRLGLTSHIADMLPADKAEAIRDLKRRGKVVAMVGEASRLARPRARRRRHRDAARRRGNA